VEPEDKKLLEESYRLSQENNRLLKSLYSSMRIRRYMSIVYWVFIIGSAIGAYYFIEPYANQVLDVFGSAKSNLNSFGDFFGN